MAGFCGCHFLALTALQERATIQEMGEEGHFVKLSKKTLSHTEVTDCTGLHRRERAWNLADLLYSRFAEKRSQATPRRVAKFRFFLLSAFVFSTATTCFQEPESASTMRPQKRFLVERRDLELFNRLLTLEDLNKFIYQTVTDVSATSRRERSCHI